MSGKRVARRNKARRAKKKQEGIVDEVPLKKRLIYWNSRFLNELYDKENMAVIIPINELGPLSDTILDAVAELTKAEKETMGDHCMALSKKTIESIISELLKITDHERIVKQTVHLCRALHEDRERLRKLLEPFAEQKVEDMLSFEELDLELWHFYNARAAIRAGRDS